jgi:hypothetical protein
MIYFPRPNRGDRYSAVDNDSLPHNRGRRKLGGCHASAGRGQRAFPEGATGVRSGKDLIHRQMQFSVSIDRRLRYSEALWSGCGRAEFVCESSLLATHPANGFGYCAFSRVNHPVVTAICAGNALGSVPSLIRAHLTASLMLHWGDKHSCRTSKPYLGITHVRAKLSHWNRMCYHGLESLSVLFLRR